LSLSHAEGPGYGATGFFGIRYPTKIKTSSKTDDDIRKLINEKGFV